MSRRTDPTPSPEPRPSPLRADAERNRLRILAAAREVFAERGLDVTIDDIARHAGVGVGTAYRRFTNREQLVEAVFEEGAGHLIALAERALTHEDPWDGFVQFFLATAEDFAEDRGLREAFLEGLHGKIRVAAARDRLIPAVSALIARAQQAGQLRGDLEPTDIPLLQLMLGAVTEHSRTVAPAVWRRYLVLLLDGLRHDRDHPTPLPHRALDKDEFDQTVA
ncbi:TetR/AcrR family transcriptional regulator [Streptomyces griseoruber]|uniref:TetR family transcriptional regulator n=1 Tax=Streptomyces griseoruber TaxID=1943 RepID=A0A117RCM4_9ACTN|nr:TetR/AcrR family transcriptional regulator [Streptomyces griseoruber]KUN83293.1 TetR family transcriptional regulator [Streptomyces griseoruber]